MMSNLLNFWAKSKMFCGIMDCANLAIFREGNVGGIGVLQTPALVSLDIPDNINLYLSRV